MMKRLLSLVVSACLALCAVVPVFADSPSAFYVERQIYQYLTEELELNSAAACGVLGNIEYESAFNLTVVGDYGTSYGLCQWHNGRYAALINFCGGQGLDYRTVEGQMMYLAYELKTGYYSVLASLRHVDNTPEGAYRAGYLWCILFERPANAEQRGIERGNTAQYKYWNRYNTGANAYIPTVTFTDIPPVQYVYEDDSSIEEPEEPEILGYVEVHAEPVMTWENSDPAPTTAAAPEQPAQSQPTKPVTKPKVKLRPFPVRPRMPAVQTEPTADYATGVSVGLGLMPMGDGAERKLRIPLPEEEPETVS